MALSIHPRHTPTLYIRLAIALTLTCGTLHACTPAPRDFNGAGNGGTAGTGGAGGSSGNGGNGGAMPIPCPMNTHRCVVPSPEGWSLPSATVEGVPSPDCPSNYPKLIVDARDDVDAPQATCGCDCGSPDIDCGDLILFYRQNCGQPIGPDVASGSPDTCLVATPKQNATAAYFIEKAGPCPAMPTTALDPPTSQTAYRSCGTNQIDGVCDNNLLCVPEIVPPFHLCVTRPGDHPCPPGYPDRTVHYAGINDSRGCTECTCVNATNGRCNSVVTAYDDALCTTPKAGSMLNTGDGFLDGGCIGSFGYYTYTKPTIADPATCTANPVMPMGNVEISDPITFCCATN